MIEGIGMVATFFMASYDLVWGAFTMLPVAC